MFEDFQHPTRTATDPGNLCMGIWNKTFPVAKILNLLCNTAPSRKPRALPLSADPSSKLDGTTDAGRLKPGVIRIRAIYQYFSSQFFAPELSATFWSATEPFRSRATRTNGRGVASPLFLPKLCWRGVTLPDHPPPQLPSLFDGSGHILRR